MAGEMTLGEFVKHLTVRMEEANLVMLFKEEAPWHVLFYKLKTANLEEKPSFFRNLRFDWDGPYPRCQELSDFIQALHWTGSVVATNPSYEKISLQNDVKKLWSQSLAAETPQIHRFLDNGIRIAQAEFPRRQV